MKTHMLLNDKYLPVYQFSEKHALSIAAVQESVIAAALAYRPDNDPIFRWAISARELPMRMLGRLSQSGGSAQPMFGMDNFTLLEKRGNEELAFGLAGKFWKLDYGQARITDGAAFTAFCEPGTAKLVLNFIASNQNDTHTLLTTETRVFCLDQEARRKFAPYWYLIRPVSGLIRRRMLSSICKTAEHAAHTTV